MNEYKNNKHPTITHLAPKSFLMSHCCILLKSIVNNFLKNKKSNICNIYRQNVLFFKYSNFDFKVILQSEGRHANLVYNVHQ